jgi:hypothetical protein
MPLTATSSNAEILAAVESWVETLALGNYELALRQVEPDSDEDWTPELLRAVIAGYGLPEPHPSGSTFRVTPPGSAIGGPPRRTVERIDVPPGALACIEHDLPLNGAWSDLTATFVLRSQSVGAKLLLQEVHVF